MCGICGIVDFDDAIAPRDVAAMCAALAHRGPDGQSVFHDGPVALGHRRLAIIDLSDGGVQPFGLDGGALQLVHNGEIYNYVELRRELEQKGHEFRTATDTEVLLTAYKEWGTRCVERFNGMWAFAIWDAPRQRLVCSRDRFGIKPFYYDTRGRRLRFASELKAFHALGRLAPNEPLVRDYLAQGHIDHTSETMFAGIHALPPAHTLVLDRDGPRLERYWRLVPQDAPSRPVEAFRELLLDAVRLHLRSDVPIGTALSGGLDSSAVAALIALLLETRPPDARMVGPRQRTFTAYFEDKGHDERPYARDVVDAVGAEAHWISFDDRDLVDALPSIVYSQDEPFASTSIVAQWFVMRDAAGAGIRVMLDGQGADEVLAGYPVYRGARLSDLLARGRLVDLARELHASNAPARAEAVSLVRPFLPDRLKWRARARATGAATLVGERVAAAGRPPTFERAPFSTRFHRTMYRILTQQGLPELLHYEDRNSMAHSIEARVPFLDHRLVELALGIPAAMQTRGGELKRVLKRAVRDVIPRDVLDRPKQGFRVPVDEWFLDRLGDRARDDVRAFCRASGLLDEREVGKLLERPRRDAWYLLSLAVWWREVVA
jgi:asparagine synthase (glutamine-hydrolysing)